MTSSLAARVHPKLCPSRLQQRALPRCLRLNASRGGRRKGDYVDRDDVRRGSSSGSSNRRRADSGSSGFQFSRRGGMYRLQYNEYETEIREDEAWKVALPLLGGLVLAASVIGPLVVGLAFTAVALGAALSAGAIFTSLFLPFFLLVGAGALLFGGLTFSAFAALGTALLLPKLMSMAVAAAGLGAGAMAVSLFLKPAANKARKQHGSVRGVYGRGEADEEEDGEVVVAAEVEAAAEEEARGAAVDPDVDRQLREFDALLAERERQRRRR
ncbi:hypothetical protein Agub_g5352 [Astrephomene gubernaculifera]|uniref:Uncharacterized protein n=1 Tax=Astrephomene gubernaculifera TaxID=47775 RepID=A0AAD3DNV0_9CHLO|nr:hypothetical protein Agub_g5352 [Astrephomene gubernaculifera]